MQAECPHCQTLFNLTEQQLQIADGMVRCGMCQEVFNALDQSASIESSTAEDAELISQEGLNNAIGENEQEETLQEHPEADQQQTSEEDTIESSDNIEEELSENSTEPPEFDIDESAESDSVVNTVAVSDSVTDDEIIEEPQAFTELTEAINELSIPDEDKTATSDLAEEYEPTDEPDITSEAAESVSNKVIPDQFIVPEITSPYSIWRDAGWVTAILLLTVGLMLQLAWFNRNELINDDALRPWAMKLCHKMNCSPLALKDPQQIEILNRNVFSHPNADDALMVSVSLINHATFSQPYPNVRIDFSNIRGETISSRTFRPEEYLNQPADKIKRLSSGANADFSLEIQDPGPEAMTYEFDFL